MCKNILEYPTGSYIKSRLVLRLKVHHVFLRLKVYDQILRFYWRSVCQLEKLRRARVIKNARFPRVHRRDGTCATSNHTVNDGVSTDHLVNRSIDTRGLIENIYESTFQSLAAASPRRPPSLPGAGGAARRRGRRRRRMGSVQTRPPARTARAAPRSTAAARTRTSFVPRRTRAVEAPERSGTFRPYAPWSSAGNAGIHPPGAIPRLGAE